MREAKKEARIVTTQVDDTPYYVIEIFDGKRWDWGYGFPIVDYNKTIRDADHEVMSAKVISAKIIDKIMSLIMQGYTIYDER